MNLKSIAFRSKQIHLKKDGSIPLSDNAPYDFEDGDTNNFKELKPFPKTPYTHEQILKAMKALHKMLEKQSENYQKGKLFKAGIVKESEEPEHQDLVAQCYELLKHLSENKDEAGLQMFMSIVSDIIDFSDDDFTKEPSKIAEAVEIPEVDAYGGILMDGNKILLREPSGHFGGYVWTFAKGRIEPGEDPQEVALREVFEETGYHARITHLIPKEFGGSTSTTVFFIMEAIGSPEPFGWETESIKWVQYDEAVDLIKQTKIASGRSRDLQILDAAFNGPHVGISKVGGSLNESSKLTDEQREKYKKWKELVNMSASSLQNFKDSQTKSAKGNSSKYPGLKPTEARKQGISSGVQSANWIIKMKNTPVTEWTPEMWRWCGKQISFISRMKGAAGPLYDEKGEPTRKLLALKIWGHNPTR
jgi:8-oxo-dGTP diphosphatase